MEEKESRYGGKDAESEDERPTYKQERRSCKEEPIEAGSGTGAVSDEDSDAEVEREFRAAMQAKSGGEVVVARNPDAHRIVQGFRINWMDMRDAATGTLVWESGEWGDRMFREELRAEVPSSILCCPAVSREINFTSREEIKKFRLEQRVFLRGACLEEWFFEFGYVIPGSTNSWQQTIEAAGEGNMLPVQELSGNITIETSFYNGKALISKTLVRIFYV